MNTIYDCTSLLNRIWYRRSSFKRVAKYNELFEEKLNDYKNDKDMCMLMSKVLKGNMTFKSIRN